MSSLCTLYRKESRALFCAPIAYLILTVFLILMGYTFAAFLFVNRNSSLIHIFFQAAVLFLLIVPVITMRQFAEERKSGTLELLLTAPIREIDLVLAKFLASMALATVMMACTLVYAAVLHVYGTPDWGPVYSGYLGLFLLTASLVAMGLTISALTTNQVVAAVLSLGLFLLLWMLDTLAALLPYPLDNIVTSFSLLAHFTPLATGAMYLSDVGFFISLTLFALLCSVRALARR